MSNGFVLAVSAIRIFQFVNAPKKAATPVKTPRIRSMPISSAPTATSLAHHGLCLSIEQVLEEGPVPVERDDRRCRRRGDGGGTYPNVIERFASRHPRGIGDLVFTGRHPLIAHGEADGTPAPHGDRAVEQPLGDGRVLRQAGITSNSRAGAFHVVVTPHHGVWWSAVPCASVRFLKVGRPRPPQAAAKYPRVLAAVRTTATTPPRNARVMRAANVPDDI